VRGWTSSAQHHKRLLAEGLECVSVEVAQPGLEEQKSGVGRVSFLQLLPHLRNQSGLESSQEHRVLLPPPALPLVVSELPHLLRTRLNRSLGLCVLGFGAPRKWSTCYWSVLSSEQVQTWLIAIQG
jgi:hypothetical protein